MIFTPSQTDGSRSGNKNWTAKVTLSRTHVLKPAGSSGSNRMKSSATSALKGKSMAFECQRNPDKGPGGYPIPSPDGGDRQHLGCCTNPAKPAIVCELKVPMDMVDWTPIAQFPDSYEISVFNLIFLHSSMK